MRPQTLLSLPKQLKHVEASDCDAEHRAEPFPSDFCASGYVLFPETETSCGLKLKHGVAHTL